MMLAKIAAVLMLIWFYQTAKEHQQDPIKWIIIGLIGYWLAWWIITLGVANPWMSSMPNGSWVVLGAIRHLPALVAVIAAVFVRKKLIADAQKNQP